MYETRRKQEVVQECKTDEKEGLTKAEASRRLKQYGANELKHKEAKKWYEMFLEQLNEPLIFILFVAAAISMLLREWSDTGIILIVIFVNAVVGVVQEGKALKALESLKQLASPTALVKREGEIYEIEAKDLVIGDLVLLEAGRQVPADLRLMVSQSLRIEEAALTGESIPAQKDANYETMKEVALGDRKNMAFTSTNVIHGRGEGIVVATGMNTEIGKIAGMLNEVEEESTPLQKRLADLGKLLSLLAILLCVFLFLLAVIQKRPIFEMLITAISLAVAAVPEGLPAVVTIVLALSVSRMVKVKTIVRRLPSVETLGCVNVVCSDKTGTLTQNKMKVCYGYYDGTIYPIDEFPKKVPSDYMKGFVLCNDSLIEGNKEIGDPTEVALLEFGRLFGYQKETMESQNPRKGEIPFDSERKMMTTLHKVGAGSISYTKGSTDEILKRCIKIEEKGHVRSLTAKDRQAILQAMEWMSKKALRVLALAKRENDKSPVEKDLIFLGLVGMLDPARPEAKGAIDTFKEAGVETIMITGDHVDTAFAIAKELGIATDKEQCISGKELDQMTEEIFLSRLNTLRVFARVAPSHKVRIVNGFKKRGDIVAMTGDGVNDAPSLKSADIGIAMGLHGTDVAKEASDFILVDDNFATIEKAIEEGRGIYANIKKAVIFLLSSNFGEIITMFLAVLVGLPSPLRASHILWINLITDSFPALALGVDKNDAKLLMEKPPRKASESLFAHGGLFYTLFYGALIGGLSLLAFLTVPYVKSMALYQHVTLETILNLLKEEELLRRSQTYAFTVLGISQLFHAVGMRNVELSIFRMKHFENIWMIGAFLFGVILQLLVTEIPYLIEIFGTAQLSIKEWEMLFFLSAMPLLAHEILAFPFGEQKKEVILKRNVQK